MWFTCFFHCLSLSLSTVICCSQSDHLYLSHMILQQTHQMLCVAASLRSLLCCVAPITTDFPKLALCSQVCRSRYNFDGFFLCYFVDVKMFPRILFFFFFYSANARAALLRCHSLNAVFWCWKCCDIVLNVTGTPCVWSNKTSRTGAQVLLPPSRAFAKSCRVCDSSNSGFIFCRSRRRSRWLCISLCVAAFFLSTKAQWEHRGDATFSPSHRHVQLRMYWECADWLVFCHQYQSNLSQSHKNTLLEIQHLTFKLATMSRFRT